MTGRGAQVHHRSMRSLAPVVGLLLVAACSTASPATSTAPASPASRASTEPSAGTTFAADDDGLRLVAEFDRLAVDGGDTVTIRLTLQNDRSVAAVFEEPCGLTTMAVDVPLPLEPLGKEWDGIAGEFKTYALEQSQGTPMESSIRKPPPTYAKAKPCHAPTTTDEAGLTTSSLAAGGTYETELTWSAEIVKGVAAAPGDAPFTIQVRHNLQPAGNGLITFDMLEVRGTIAIAGGGTQAISPGLALDAALGDKAFAAWLAKQPRRSWENANLFLQPGAIAVDVLPEVPYWDVELFRTPRNWAILYLDAASGEVLKASFCDIPCDR